MDLVAPEVRMGTVRFSLPFPCCAGSGRAATFEGLLVLGGVLMVAVTDLEPNIDGFSPNSDPETGGKAAEVEPAERDGEVNAFVFVAFK